MSCIRSERPQRARIRALTLGLAALAGVSLPAIAHGQSATEAAASAAFDAVSGNAAQLRVFLQAMPKGADLHNHLGGSTYAEDFLKFAAEKGLCADDGLTRIVPGPCAPDRAIATMAVADPFAYARLVDGLSTRGFQQGTGPALISGHDQFFASFGRFGPAYRGGVGRWLADAYASAARNHVVYLELMYNPDALSDWYAAAGDEPLDEAGLAASYAREVKGVNALLGTAMAQVSQEEAEARTRLGCGTKVAEPGCDVAVHYLFSGMRGIAPAKVWRSLIAGFALAHKDPRFVGVNIVMPEDDPVALRDYDLHMAMFRFLEAKYPDVKATMHAGELTLGLVPPRDLEDHIARAIDAGARRIGHGVDIAYETHAPETLARMAREGIAVEVNLTSNAVILGVEGGNHPIHLYRAAGVPVTLSTDDEGVLRSDMTAEYMRAAQQQGLRYADLKQITRAGLEYAFVPGVSLWLAHALGSPVEPCAASLADARCKAFLSGSEKARLQARLEAQLTRFEQSLGASHPSS